MRSAKEEDASAATLVVSGEQFKGAEFIPSSAAHAAVGGANRSPQLSWTRRSGQHQVLRRDLLGPRRAHHGGSPHWVRFDIRPSKTSLTEGAGSEPVHTGLGLGGERGDGGMAPPAGDPPHHYQFTVYALDEEKVGLDDHTTYAKFRFVIGDHILASGTLVGLYAVAGEGQ